jgi:GAF domain-containing protein
MDLATSSERSTLFARQQLALDMIERGAPLADTLALLCHIVEAEANTSVRAAILLLDPVTLCLRTGAAPTLPDRYNLAIDGIRIDPHVGTCASAAALGHVVITTDIESDVAWTGIAHLPLGLGLLAAWSMPIVGSAGGVLGTFGTYFTERRGPTEVEVELVSVLVRTAEQAIERAMQAPTGEPAH